MANDTGFNNNIATFIGNLTDDPEVRMTQGGVPVTTIRIASSRRYTDRDGNQQESTTYMNVVCWRDLAQNVGESLHKGDRVMAIGHLRVRSYENRDGQTVWVTEIEADEVGASLRWASADVKRSRGGGGGGGGFPQAPAAPPLDADDIPF
jgi:single-strand DNA-binding protein